jgi:hypothetical protein
MLQCDYLREPCTPAMELSPPPMYSPSPLSAASCEPALLIAAAPTVADSLSIAMPPLETSKMGGLAGGAGNVAATIGGSVTGNNNNNNNNNPLADHHHLLLAAAVNSAGGVKKSYAEQTDSELAELATQEISLDLQGLIDDTHFADENLFGDLMETAKKNEVNGTSPQSSWLALARAATPGSSSGGSSGQNSPGSEGQNSPPSYGLGGGGGGGFHRGAGTLAYLPGSVHSGASFAQLGHVNQQQQQQQQQQRHHHHHHQNIQVSCYKISAIN